MKLKVTLIKSTNACLEKQKRTVGALGLKKINSFKIHDDNAAVRGMLAVVSHMVRVESVSGEAAKTVKAGAENVKAARDDGKKTEKDVGKKK